MRLFPGILAVALLTAFTACTHAQTPWPTGGWTTSTPEEQGMDSARLDRAATYIRDNCSTRYSFLVFRNGRLVFERYFNGSNAAQQNNIKSMSKSMLSMLTGIALEEGKIRSVEQKLDEFFPDYYATVSDQRKHDVTLQHLLTMTAGFEWSENSSSSVACFNSRNWHKWVIDSRLVNTPGTTFNYSTGLTHLLSGILTRSTGMSTFQYADSRLFTPLGISCSLWTQDPQGYYFGGSEVWLTARDLAKFGLLFLRNGQWDGRQIVPAEWLRKSSQLRIRTGADLGDYAYLWWKYMLNGYMTTLASGYGGQNIFVVPELDLMMVTTAKSDYVNAPWSVYADPYQLFANYVIPAVNAPAPSITTGGVVHAADYAPRLAQGAFGALFGSDFSLTETNWDSNMPVDGAFPTSLAGVSVRIGERNAYPNFVSSGQVNFLVPPDMPAGLWNLQVRTPKGSSTKEVEVVEAAPALYTSVRDGRRYAAPQPVRAGEEIALWASGLGPSDPAAPVGSVLPQALPLARTPEVYIAGHKAEVTYAGLAMAGLWQVNVRIPSNTPTGLATVQLRSGDAAGDSEAVVEVKQ